MSGRDLKEIPAEVLEAAQRIWFAGLGAMVLAQEEGSKLVGNTGKLFTLLVEKGQELQEQGTTSVKGVAGTAEDAWSKIQALLDAQVTAALHRLGVPTTDEIGELTKRIEQLTASIEALKAQS